MHKATVITFDADGTLWDFRLVMRRALSHVLVALRQAVPVPAAHALTVDDMVGIRNDAAQASHLRCSRGTFRVQRQDSHGNGVSTFTGALRRQGE